VKKNLSVCITLFAALATPTFMSAQQPRYKLIDMGTFGGPQSFLNDGNQGNNAVSVLNNHGTLAGWADTSLPDPSPLPVYCFNAEDCYVEHAFTWQEGNRLDLGALVEDLSSQANWISPNGLVVGLSDNGEFDPLVPGLMEARAVLWRDHKIMDLGTLPEGGYESWANAVNSKGQVIGWATNTVPDLYSMAAPFLPSMEAPFLPTQTRAFLWQKGAMQDLGTLGTGTDAIAQFINERGQIVGWSYTGGTPPPACIFAQATDSFIWDKKNGMTDLGNLGGACVIATGINDDGVVIGDNTNDQPQPVERAFIWKNGVIQDLGGSIGGLQTGAEGINASGQVAGFATYAGDFTELPLFHAVVWNRVGEITDLGALGTDVCSFATGINSKAQVVGGSAVGCVFDSQSHAVLWEHGSVFDLNTVIAPGASLTLELAQGINDRGEIAGVGVDRGNNQHAFLLVPCDEDSSPDCQEVSASSASIRPLPAGQVAPNTNSPTVRRMPRRRMPPLSPGPFSNKQFPRHEN
jgi:probable HAF family extracellular repeat protein